MIERTRRNLIDLLKSRERDVVNGVDKLFHSLQTATRAFHDGRDDEYVVCALFHDVAGGVSPEYHASIAATLLRPYINDDNWWMVHEHALYQADNWEGRLHKPPSVCTERAKRAIEFVDKYDFPSFDPNYPTEPLETFLPLIERVIK